jgi:hypothetical protein
VFASPAHAIAAYRHTVQQSVLPDNTILVPKRSHVDNVMHSLLRQLRQVADQAEQNSILRTYSLRIHQDRIVLYHAYTLQTVAEYPIYKHISDGNLYARLPIAFSNITATDIARIYKDLVDEFLTETAPPSPASSDPFNLRELLNNNRYAALQETGDIDSDHSMPQAQPPPEQAAS